MAGLFGAGVRGLGRRAAISGLVGGLINGLICGSVFARDRPCPRLEGDRPGFNSVWLASPTGWVQAIGRQRDQHYGVVVPSHAEQVLSEVQVCVPDAFLVESRWGNYIQSGFFYRRVEAEALSKALESRRIDARVIYYP
ncbi:MAG: hypothetical protein HC860_05350 [Alkalinema sp. RU_4_3]|nr:hypothetical protein [Alkalinema sp. RU_4_3]